MKKMTLRETERQIKLQEESLSKLKESRTAMLPSKTVKCLGNYVSGPNDIPNHKPGCQKRVQIGKLIYIQDHWYTEPHGCSGGDYWNQGEGAFICPSCGRYNRLANRDDVVELKHSFKEVLKVHREGITLWEETVRGKKRYFPVLGDK